MRILVTGAAGFIGRTLVRQAVTAGHTVHAVVHRSIPGAWKSLESVSVLQNDLSDPDGLREGLETADCVIHLAADMHNGRTGFEKSLEATRNLCDAMSRFESPRLLLVSSIAVINYASVQANSTIDETTEARRTNEPAADYAAMKSEQETIARQWQLRNNAELLVVRPGIVFGDEQLSSAHAGITIRNCSVAATHSGEVPVIHVDDVVNALLLAVTNWPEHDLLHLIGSNLPSQTDYLRELKQRGHISLLIPLHWRGYAALAALTRAVLGLISKRAIPNGFLGDSVLARMTPYEFENHRAREALNWSPRNDMKFSTRRADPHQEDVRCD